MTDTIEDGNSAADPDVMREAMCQAHGQILASLA